VNRPAQRLACGLSLLVLGLAVPGPRPARAVAQGEKPVSVEPGELTRRPDLVGKRIAVEDRVGRFQYHPGENKGNDEVYLRRCPDVTFALPPKLRDPHPTAVSVRMEGVLRRTGELYTVEVSAIDMLPADVDRLNRAVATVPRSDFEGRTAWVRWAEERAKAFQDVALMKRAREVEADAFRAESERPPRDRDPAAFFLDLAARARQRRVAEPEPSALAHRGFRAALGAAKSPPDLAALVGRIEAFFPVAKTPAGPAADAELARWETPYAHDPAAAYRAAGPAARAAFDHRLWADATQKRIQRQAAADPRATIALAEEAAGLLPDRPGLATSLLGTGLTAESKNIAALRKDEVDSLARLYSDRLKQPDRARELYRTWLDDQRTHRLSPRDADGRLALAGQYESLLNDSATAVALLREAWAIDPQSRELADAFRRRGFRKAGDEWVEPPRATPGDGEPARRNAVKVARDDQPKDEPAPPGGGEGATLLGSTPEQVRSHFGGKPNHRSWCTTQGQLTEQWVYVGARSSQYITFARRSGESHARVTSFYSVPRSALEPPAVP
jgi:hypothetical protein